MFPPLPRITKPAQWVANKVLRAATIATMPHWMRDLANLHQPRILDPLMVPVMRGVFRVVAANKRLEVFALGMLSPKTRPVAAPVLHGIPPEREETLTPAQARERYRTATPRELYGRLRSDAIGGESAAVGT
jgi:hypothetical protein